MKMMETKFRIRIEIIRLLTFSFKNGRYRHGEPNERESIQKFSGLPENKLFLMKC